MNKSITFVISAVLTAVLLVAVASGMALSGSNLTDGEYNYYHVGLTPLDRETIVTYGKLPELKTEEQRQNWSYNLEKLEKSLEFELFPNYIYPAGKVLTFGKNSRGYFVIVFYKNLTIEKQLIDEIYAIIDKNARKIDIQEVPVEFSRGIYSQGPDTANLPEPEKSAYEKYLKSGRDLYKPVIISTYGKLPELKTEEQRWNWLHRDQRAIIEGSRNKIDLYFFPKGPLVAFGDNYDGYFEATVYQNLTVEKSLLDEIYGIIDEEAKKRGIQEVPVRFVLGDMARPAILTIADKSSIEDSGNAMPPPNEISSKSVPGFGLPGGLISLLCIWLFRRR